MGKSQFRKRAREAPRYPTRRDVVAILGAGALAACGPVVMQGEPAVPEVVDAGAPDSGLPDAGGPTAGVAELPDAGEPDAGEPTAGVPELPDAGD